MTESSREPSDAQLDSELEAADLEHELEAIRTREAELNRQKLEIMDRQRVALRRAHEEKLRREREAEQERIRKEQEQEIEIRVCDFNGFFVNVKVLPDIRSDILNLLRNIYGRQFDAFSAVNRIPAESWVKFKEDVTTLPHVKVTHLLGIEGKIKKYLTMPDFSISIDSKQLKVETHSQAPTRYIADIPGSEFFRDKGYWTAPLTEGWRLFQKLELYAAEIPEDRQRGVIWAPDALRLVEAEVERRTKLDTVALQQDSTFDVKFENGFVLRPFQRVGIEFIDLSKGRALVADQMGLGKTWESIGWIILRNLRSVIVCPAHLKANWAREIHQLTGQFPAILSGREPSKYDVELLLITKPQFTIINYDILAAKTKVDEQRVVDEKGDIHVTPPKERFLWAELIMMSKPDVIVVDEAHYTKNTDSNRSKATRMLQVEHRIAMTGTPVLNRPGEYWAILNWLRPELFPSEDKFIWQYTNNGRTARNVEELRDLLKPIMIRRLKKDVVSELPPINRITELHELSEDAVVVYKKVLAGVYKAIDDAGNQIERNVANILVEIGKLKEVCAHDKVDRVADLATELFDTEQDAADAKLGNKKVLIFSQYKDVVRKVAARLGREAIYWTGDTDFAERTRLENEFQTNPDVHFLVVSLMTGQTGLNLTAAGHVIFADLYWTPAAHAQAEERAYGRLSNMHGCDSYYVVAERTIEEWIQEMLAAKLETINAVVEGIDSERDPSIGMAIIQKLKQLRGQL